jgi:putative FmdB family regulatory protein
MPIYEYACACGKVFEELIVRSADDAGVVCPVCKSRQVSRLLSRTASPRASGTESSRGGGACGPAG